MNRVWISGMTAGMVLAALSASALLAEDPIRQPVDCQVFAPYGELHDTRNNYAIPIAPNQGATGTRSPYWGGMVRDTRSGTPETGYIMDVIGYRVVTYYGQSEWAWQNGQVRMKCAVFVDSATGVRTKQIDFATTGWTSGNAYKVSGEDECDTQIVCDPEDDGSGDGDGSGSGGTGGGNTMVLWCLVTTSFNSEGEIISVFIDWESCEWRNA